MQVGPELSPLQEFRVVTILLSNRKMIPFGKMSPIDPNTNFNLLDYQLDTLRFIFKPKNTCWEEIEPPTGLETSPCHIFETPNETFLKKAIHFEKFCCLTYWIIKETPLTF